MSAAAWMVVAASCASTAGHQPAVRPSPAALKTSGDERSFLLQAADQYTDGSRIVVGRAVLSASPGYIAIHPQQGEPWPVIASSALLPEGESKNVIIRLDPPVKPPTVVFAMIHLDDNGNRRFDFPAADAAPKVGSDFVWLPLRLTVRR